MASIEKAGVLITGAAKRVGAHLARAMAADGHPVVAHFHTSGGDADALAAEISAAGGTITMLSADLGAPDAPRRLIASAMDACPSLAVLVNNASVFSYDRPDDASAAALSRHMEVNAIAPILLAQAFHAALDGKRNGVIVNMLDAKLASLNPDYFSYTVSKYALLGATKMMAMSFAPRVRVAGIAPGILLPSGEQSAAAFEVARKKTPLGLNTSLDEVANALRFIIASPAYTGDVIVLDGGETLRPAGRDIAFL